MQADAATNRRNRNTGRAPMIDALISGRLAADPKPGISKNGNAYATARVLVTANTEDRLTVSVIAFYAGSGVQFPGSGAELRGFDARTRAERDLGKHRPRGSAWRKNPRLANHQRAAIAQG